MEHEMVIVEASVLLPAGAQAEDVTFELETCCGERVEYLGEVPGQGHVWRYEMSAGGDTARTAAVAELMMWDSCACAGIDPDDIEIEVVGTRRFELRSADD